jgi:hypothetical protein
MDKLDLLFNPKKFADAFGASLRDSRFVAMESDPDATVWFEGGAASTRAELQLDHGQIDYRGNCHSFSISGLSVAHIPPVNIFATGIVRRLKTLSDFVGDYLAAATEGRSTAGSKATLLRNDRGMLIQLVATDARQRFNISVNGVRIRFKASSAASRSACREHQLNVVRLPPDAVAPAPVSVVVQSAAIAASSVSTNCKR